MKIMIAETFGRLKAGEVVEVDNIKLTDKFGSGVALRIVGVWKKPQWFDLNWFVVPTSDEPSEESEG